jgi:rare lipoprotein A
MGEQSARIELGRLARVGAPIALSLLLANCAAGDRIRTTSYSPRVVADGEPIPKGGGTYKLGNPYTINGRTYYPEHNSSYRSEGIASWYGRDFHGRKTANGEVYDMNAISAAHPTMPMPSYARVTNLANGRSIVVRVNDRGPYVANRVIDLSIGAAKALGTHGQGLARVRVEYVGRASLAGSDDTQLLASLRNGTPAPPPSSVRVASARVPSFGDARAADGTPLPTERPFELGTRSQVRTPPATPPRRARTPVTVAPDYAVAAPVPDPPPAEPAGALGLMSGRGLY